MPYQPISPSPYLQTIDSKKRNTFSCIINPRDFIYKYVLKIIENDTGEIVLTIIEDLDSLTYTGKSSNINSGGLDGIYTKTITDPAFLQLPIRGESTYTTQLEIDIPEYYIVQKDSEKTFGDYIWNIELFDSNNNSVLSCDYYFMVRDSAAIKTFNDGVELSEVVPNIIASNKVSICTNYLQAQNILPAYYCFNLYFKNELIYTTNDIVSSNILFEYDALVSGYNYILELIICDDNKTQTKTEYELCVNYQYFKSLFEPIIKVNDFDSSIEIDYSNNIGINGKYDVAAPPPLLTSFVKSNAVDIDNFTEIPGVCIPMKQILYWDDTSSKEIPLDLDNTNQILNWHGHKGFDGVIVEKYNPNYLYNKIIVGHSAPLGIVHDSNINLIYSDTENEMMPIGIPTNDSIQAGFYYQFGLSNKIYISEFSKITSAIYRASLSDVEINDEDIILEDDTLYILNDDDTINDDDILIDNDVTYNHWWTIGILANKAIIFKNDKYTEKAVDE